MNGTSPLPIEATLKEAVRDVADCWRKLLVLAAVPALPLAYLIAKLEWDDGYRPLDWWDQNQLVGAFELIFGAAVSLAALRLLLRQDTRLWTAVSFALRRWFWCGEASFIISEMVGIGLFLLVVPAFLVFVLTSLALPALALGAQGSYEAILQSRQAARSAFWSLALLLLACMVPPALIDLVIAWILDRWISSFATDFVIQAVELLISALIGTVPLAALGRAYVKLRATV